jgi:predicted AlkP superfamily pyrophosphatase or phosphodiesterase
MPKVILVVIDGCRPDALDAASTPVIDRLIASGASTMSARTVEPSITLPAHFSLFTSLNPRDHNVTTNTGNPSPSSTACSIFEAVKNQQLKTAAVYSWELLRNLAPPNALHTSFYLDTHQTGHTDLDITENAARMLTQQQPDFCFLYLEGVDQAGHEHGWMSSPYLAAVEQADAAVGKLMEALETAGLQNEYAILMQSDHGGQDHHHLEPTDMVMTIFWLVCGPGIRPGHRIESTISILDTAPTIARLLDLPPHYSWIGRAPHEIFN